MNHANRNHTNAYISNHPVLFEEMGNEYIKIVNQLTEQAEAVGAFPKLTSKDVEANLPSAVKNQAIRDAKSIHNKTKKKEKRPVLKRRAYYVNNQNYSIGDNARCISCYDGRESATALDFSPYNRARAKTSV